MRTLIKVAFAAVFIVVAMPVVSHADDFVSLCAAQDKTPEAEKACKCASDKVTGADRATAIEAMKGVTAAAASGKAEDAAAAMQKYGKGMEIVMTAEASCM